MKSFLRLLSFGGLLLALVGCQQKPGNLQINNRGQRAGAAIYSNLPGSGVNIVADSKVSGDPNGTYQNDVSQLASGSISPTDLGTVDDAPAPDPLGAWVGVRLCLSNTANLPQGQIFSIPNAALLVKIWDSYAQAAQASGQDADLSVPIYMTGAQGFVSNGTLSVQFSDSYGQILLQNIPLSGAAGSSVGFTFNTSQLYNGTPNNSGAVQLGSFPLDSSAMGCN
jgi:hypothetical protein